MGNPNIAYISLIYLTTIYRNDDETLEDFKKRINCCLILTN